MISVPAFAALFNRLIANCNMPSQVWRGNGEPPIGFISAENFMDEFYQLMKDKEEGQVRETIDEWIRTSEDRFFPYPRELRRLWATMFGGLTQAQRARDDRIDVEQRNQLWDERYERIKSEVESWPRAMQIAHKNRLEQEFNQAIPKFILESKTEFGPFLDIGKKIYFIKTYEEMAR